MKIKSNEWFLNKTLNFKAFLRSLLPFLKKGFDSRSFTWHQPCNNQTEPSTPLWWIKRKKKKCCQKATITHSESHVTWLGTVSLLESGEQRYNIKVINNNNSSTFFFFRVLVSLMLGLKRVISEALKDHNANIFWWKLEHGRTGLQWQCI